MSIAAVETRRQAWLARYPVLRTYLGTLGRQRVWTTPLGRRVELPDDRAEHAAAGWLWQSIEADALRMVMLELGHPVVFTAHDEVLVEVPENEAEQARTDLVAAMNTALLEVANLPRTQGLTTTRVDVRHAWQIPAAQATPHGFAADPQG